MKISVSRAGDELTAVFRGDINETCEDELKDLLSKIEVPNLHIDTERVELVNSLGARFWVNFVQSIVKKGIKTSFKKCSPAIVECCNIYPKFMPASAIESLYVPCECQSCALEENVLLTQSDFKKPNPVSDAVCQKCKSPMQAQVELGEYLQCVSGG